ncbi:MAG: [Fe-Fe] hydrogenase large subunit C-terminal domain-containing protein [bacterium]|nr:[Fe-Fe] hydrogenase large subunit C-terminal domain-containing protein [bacterium]
MKNIKIKINNKEIVCSSEQTIMQVAKKNNIDIPGLCNHSDFSVKANCRVCVVEIIGRRNLATSCSTKVEDGMEIKTDTERVNKARNLNIELIFAEHIEKCPNCIWRVNCQLLDLAKKYKIKINRFKDRKSKRKIYKFANAIEIDGSQCIDCRNCLDACSFMQNINYLQLVGKGTTQEVVPVGKDGCIYCGQCAVHCPVGAAQEQTHWEMVEKALKDKGKIVVAQFVPQISASIGEEFGLSYDKNSTSQIVSGFRQLGFNYVFDVNLGADMTIKTEAEDLLKRLIKKEKKLSMFSSCCPAWVKYVEFYRSEFISNLTKARSPHINNGGFIKTYLAEQLKIDTKKIIVVSIMPCTAKKFEITRQELKINNNFPVDYVLTTRELAWLFKKNNIEFGKLKNSLVDSLRNNDNITNVCSVNGGVMGAVLCKMQDLLCDEKKIINVLDFKDVNGLVGVKEAKIKIADKILRVAIINGIGNIKQILDKVEDYDYIEVMACPDGCVGGGGQPIPTTFEIRQKRLISLFGHVVK